MNSTLDRNRPILVSNRDPRDDAALEASILAAGFTDVQRLDPRSLDDVDRMAAAGHVDRVVFAHADDLLVGCWDDQIRVDKWPTTIRINVLDLPLPDARPLADVVVRSWRCWNLARRRRNAVAGAILSVIAMLAAFVLSR